jgi:uncharacterized protein YacL
MSDTPPPPAPGYSSGPESPNPNSNPYASPAPAYAPATTNRVNILAVISLVLAFIFSLGAVICGHIALSQIRRTGESGRGLAIAGLVLGYLGLVAGLILVISVFVLASSGVLMDIPTY